MSRYWNDSPELLCIPLASCSEKSNETLFLYWTHVPNRLLGELSEQGKLSFFIHAWLSVDVRLQGPAPLALTPKHHTMANGRCVL